MVQPVQVIWEHSEQETYLGASFYQKYPCPVAAVEHYKHSNSSWVQFSIRGTGARSSNYYSVVHAEDPPVMNHTTLSYRSEANPQLLMLVLS